MKTIYFSLVILLMTFVNAYPPKTVSTDYQYRISHSLPYKDVPREYTPPYKSIPTEYLSEQKSTTTTTTTTTTTLTTTLDQYESSRKNIPAYKTIPNTYKTIPIDYRKNPTSYKTVPFPSQTVSSSFNIDSTIPYTETAVVPPKTVSTDYLYRINHSLPYKDIPREYTPPYKSIPTEYLSEQKSTSTTTTTTTSTLTTLDQYESSRKNIPAYKTIPNTYKTIPIDYRKNPISYKTVPSISQPISTPPSQQITTEISKQINLLKQKCLSFGCKDFYYKINFDADNIDNRYCGLNNHPNGFIIMNEEGEYICNIYNGNLDDSCFLKIYGLVIDNVYN